MREKKNTCPVCFTKMNYVNKVLVCPECGYKLCDHSYQYHDSYSTSHSHTPNYTTTSSRPVPPSSVSTGSMSVRPVSGNYNGSNRGNAPQKENKTVKPQKIVLIVVLFYFVAIFLNLFFSLFFR